MPPPSIVFAHSAYRLGEAFAAVRPGAAFREVRDLPGLEAVIAETDVLVVSGLWRNAFAARAPRLKLIQSISAGTDQYDREVLNAHGIRLASAKGVNANAVAEHGLALMLALTRRIPEASRNQATSFWRGMIADPASREAELAGKTLVIVGLGAIGTRLARFAKALDMTVVGIRRSGGSEPYVDRLVPPSALHEALGTADIVALTCPLTSETEKLIDARALAAMKPTAILINCARGKVVDEPALIAALASGGIAAAGLDCVVEEPLPPSSPLWAMPNVLITPHSAGETQAYERGIIALLTDNLERLERGETDLRNGIV